MTNVHRTDYDEYYAPVNMERIFGNGEMDYTETLADIRSAVIEVEWTDTLDELFDAILWSEYSPTGWANVSQQSVATATKNFDHAYRALKTMADKGQIRPVMV